MLEKAEARGCYEALHKADLLKRLPFADCTFGALVCVGTTTYLEPTA